MEQEEMNLVEFSGAVVPESVLLSRNRANKYGSVVGLDDEELADPYEIERQVMLAEWGPVLVLPVKGKKRGMEPSVDETAGVDWGAFATVDFERLRPEFDKRMYRADRLREELGDVIILLDIVKARLPKAMYLVLKYLREGIIDDEHVAGDDMLALARLDRRARRIQQEVVELKKSSWDRRTESRRRMFAGWRT